MKGREMEYIAQDGTVLTDELLDDMAKEYEEGTWSGNPSLTQRGRPRLYDDDMVTVSFRLSPAVQQAMVAASERLGISRSQFFRNAVEHELMACEAN